jgi:hypothetical protein
MIAEAIKVIVTLKVEYFSEPLTITLGLFAVCFDCLGVPGTFIQVFAS